MSFLLPLFLSLANRKDVYSLAATCSSFWKIYHNSTIVTQHINRLKQEEKEKVSSRLFNHKETWYGFTLGKRDQILFHLFVEPGLLLDSLENVEMHLWSRKSNIGTSVSYHFNTIPNSYFFDFQKQDTILLSAEYCFHHILGTKITIDLYKMGFSISQLKRVEKHCYFWFRNSRANSQLLHNFKRNKKINRELHYVFCKDDKSAYAMYLINSPFPMNMECCRLF